MGKEAILRGVAEVEIERDIYRKMVQVLLGQAHEREVAADRIRQTIRQHRQDDRRVRERARPSPVRHVSAYEHVQPQR